MDALSTGHTTGDQMLTRIDMLDACAHVVGNDRTALGRRRARQPMRAAAPHPADGDPTRTHPFLAPSTDWDSDSAILCWTTRAIAGIGS